MSVDRELVQDFTANVERHLRNRLGLMRSSQKDLLALVTDPDISERQEILQKQLAAQEAALDAISDYMAKHGIGKTKRIPIGATGYSSGSVRHHAQPMSHGPQSCQRISISTPPSRAASAPAHAMPKQCFPTHVYIGTTNGSKSVEDLVVGDEVLSIGRIEGSKNGLSPA
jgi:hypothetical protein